MKVLVTQSCLTLCDTMAWSLPAVFVHQILQARRLEWVAIPFFRISSQSQESNPGLLDCRQVFSQLFVVMGVDQSLSHIWLCNPMNCNKPGFAVLHYLPEFAQTQVHWASIQSNHLILCHPLLLPCSVFPSIRVFSNESVLCIRWPKYWSFSFNISPSNEYSGLISIRIGYFHITALQGTLKSLFQHHSSKASVLQRSTFFMVQLSHPYMTTGKP